MIVRLSVVICTRNRALQLRRCLEHVLKLRASYPWELLLVDNGSDDDTSAVIAEYQSRHPEKLRHTYEPLAGLGRARNRGWQLARGSIISFTDDDCYPDRHFLSATVAAFDNDASLGFIGGRIELYDPTDYPITIQNHPQRLPLPAGRIVPPGLIQGANLSIRRTALQDCGGFDDLFGAGTDFACEDIDVVSRISGLGWAGAYDPTVLVLHHHGRKSETVAARLMRVYDQGRGAYFAKCLLNPRLRLSTVRYWGRRMTRQSLQTTLRELRAAVSYTRHRKSLSPRLRRVLNPR